MSETRVDVTVVIPTYNRRDVLLRTLAALARSDYPRDRWEAVVVDDGSPEPGMGEVEDWVRGSGVPIRYVRVPNGGPAKARNFGASLARGRVLIFLDNDVVVGPDFISRHLATLRAHPGCWVLGRIVHPPELRQTPFGRFRDEHQEAFHRAHSGPGVSVVEGGLSAANLSLPAEDFRRLGGFNESFATATCEDSELGLRASLAGVRVLYDPAITGLHDDWADTLPGYCRRSRLYSRSNVLYWRMYGDACPLARYVLENAPVDWKADPWRLVLKKAAKRVAVAPPGPRLLEWGCRVIESIAPDSALSRKAYNLAIGAAIFRGVREGWREHVASAGGPPKSATAIKV